MNSHRNHTVFAVAIFSIVLVVGGLIYHQERILKEGQTTILATRPVDPRDLFRGEYVILRYSIENDEKVLAEIDGVEDGSALFIKLSEDEDGIAYVNEAHRTAPKVFEGLWIEGEVDGRRVRFPSLEQFYLPEGTGKQVERLGDNLHVKVILKDGEARVVQLLDKTLNVIDPKSYLE